MQQAEKKDCHFLGRGLSFPPAFDKRTKDLRMVEGPADIRQSLEIILSTRQRERPLAPAFGCNLDQLLFEPITLSFITKLQNLVGDALLLYEPRIEVKGVNIEPDSNNEGLLLIKVDYKIPSANSRFNFVYPFYLEEGTDLDGQ